VDSDVAQSVPDSRAGLHHLLGEAGEQLVEQLPAAGVQRMHMTTLRHPPPVGHLVRQDVPLNHRHTVIGIR
jgi:hypothetical protein